MSVSDSKPDGNSDLAELCRNAAAGEQEALPQLLGLYHHRLAGYVHRKIGPDWRGKIDDDDILQEAFIDVYRTIGSFEHRDEDSFYHWVSRIIDHKFIDAVRALRRKKRDVGREAAAPETVSRHESFVANHFADSLTASKVMRKEDAVAAMMSCIARLSPDYQLVVKRFHLAQEPLATIAADMGRSEDAVRRLASRAVEQLHECLGKASRYFSGHD